jgi:hypothetical protein
VARHQLTYPIRHGARINVPEADNQALLPFNDIMKQET